MSFWKKLTYRIWRVKVFIYPYKKGSGSVACLKDALGAKIIKLENSNFKGANNKVVVNWGNSTSNEEVEKCIVINTPEAIAVASNKLKFFQAVGDVVRIPDFSTDREVAEGWAREGNTVVVREKLQGHSGEGLRLIENMAEFENYNHDKAKLYVRYIPKKQEYRVHVMGGKVLLIQRKARKTGIPKEMVNWKVRSHDNGFVFAKNEDHVAPEDVSAQAILAVEATGLDFGAVDVVWNEFRKEAYVIEVNTAPGLEGTTGDTYMQALRQLRDFINETLATDEEDFDKAKMSAMKRYAAADLKDFFAQPKPLAFADDDFEPAQF